MEIEPPGSQPTRVQRTLIIEAGDHRELTDSDLASYDLPYRGLKLLGHGGCASVEMVQDTCTGAVYARKVFKNVFMRDMKEAKRRLKEEVQIMKKLAAHHHIVKVHATYIVKRELAIILDPVAEGGDLASYLQDCRDGLFEDSEETKRKKKEILRRSLGCLAAGLAFMHKQTIRHKDIKPQNILIHHGSVMYTDFGLSYDFSDAGQSTTTGMVQGFTKRYCAPEVATGASRNSKSDVFSLGCVYLEIMEALYPGILNETLHEGPYHEKIRDLETLGKSIWAEEYMRTWKKPVFNIFELEYMLNINPSYRPSASQVFQIWVEESNAKPVAGEDLYFCSRCSVYKQIEGTSF